jgi:hypothetical protein
MQCPICRQFTRDAWQLLVRQMHVGYRESLQVEPPGGIVGSHVGVDFMYCENPECKQLVVRVHEVSDLPPHAVASPETLTRTWLARPRSGSRPLDPLVPEPLRKDYLEAAAILDISPRMSAVLSRKIVFDLLEQYAGITEYTLKGSLDKFIGDTSHPARIRENLQHLREIGDFGAHTKKDGIGQIIEVSQEDAEWTLDLVDRLFDYFILDPDRDKQLRATWDKNLQDAGRKPIAPPPEEETT